MERKPVSARMIKNMGWENQTMEVEYLSGAIYQYHEVNENDYIRASIGNIDKKVRLIGESHAFTKVKSSNHQWHSKMVLIFS